jgi:predicted nucleotidyltransferase
MNDHDFSTYVTDVLAGLSGVQAVALGGSRAQGTERPESDWDFAIYYRGAFDPQEVRGLNWKGEVFELGGWGGGVFNGGAWLEVDDRKVDVHYRDLDSVEHEMAEATLGRFRIEALMFHLAGIPSYLVVAELALGKALRGDLPNRTFPPRLRELAPTVWWHRADRLFWYADKNYAAQGKSAQCVGTVVQAASCAAHAILAARGEWITNEKSLLERAGLSSLNQIVSSAPPEEEPLKEMVQRARELSVASLARAGVSTG